ncbi:MAG: NADH-quinone oxidoreductase subunit D [Elusimicrobia bacterium]|nr:NADH-quinone oxidoreductase subunit D [Elusimicrobiota bacterium]
MTHKKSYFLNMGPAHPAMHGVIRLVLELDGERILNTEVEIGYLHRAFEKHTETETWSNAVPYTDRLNYVSPLINNSAFCCAVETVAGVSIPERVRYLRVIASEISRVADHLTCVGASAMELGAFTVFLYLMEGREYLYQLIDCLCGARVTTDYARLGGVKGDLPEGFAERFRAVAPKIRKVVADSEALLNRNRIFLDRVEGVGVISQADALAYGITGPFLRSTGVAYDVRRAHPYLVYDRLDFEVPVGTRGDNLDRYLVRLAEIEQSLRIVEQCFAQMPEGPVALSPWEMKDAFTFEDMGKAGSTALLPRCLAKTCRTLDGSGRDKAAGVRADEPALVLPSKEEVYGSIEGLMNQFEAVMWSWGMRVPAGEAYHAVEGGNGELGFHVVSDGSDRAYRVRCRPPCLFIMAALPQMLNGGYVADVVATFGSVNMIAGELDR